MKVLAVETATAWQSIALLDDERVLARCDQDAAGSHARLLLPAIDRVFSEAGLIPARLEGLVVSIGPGSFTGLRVGLSTVLGIRTVTQLPLVLVPTLEAMAWNLRHAATPLCPVINSRRGEVYWALYQWRDRDHLERLSPEQVGTAWALGKQLTGPVVLYGEGWETEKASIKASADATVTITEAGAHMRPSAVSVGLAGLRKLSRGERAGIEISPMYIQRPEAELKYEQSGGVSPVARRQEKVARKLRNRLAMKPARPRRKA
ncbi:MAG TPA: tRNA (adenosine(37)-N6)-threonylcarbamoyltransferase complex dimerization subunit type 1 TsaB [Nitrospira sp.]|nr:tRNA (adenosine(37)-N6)-threonylcarbamoyltransferase complex dimerization subunit type 1 TsaB [Nitrospira sp.]